MNETMLPYGNPFGVSVLKVADPVDATKVLDNSASVGNVDTSPAIGGDAVSYTHLTLPTKA